MRSFDRAQNALFPAAAAAGVGGEPVFPRLRFDETCAAPHATSQPTLASFRASSDLSARSDGICARGHAF
eukprot:3063164-Pleurochrysis_carterae.AAC.1